MTSARDILISAVGVVLMAAAGFLIGLVLSVVAALLFCTGSEALG